MESRHVKEWGRHEQVRMHPDTTVWCAYGSCLKSDTSKAGRYILCAEHYVRYNDWLIKKLNDEAQKELVKAHFDRGLTYRPGAVWVDHYSNAYNNNDKDNSKGKVRKLMTNARKAIKNALMSKEERLVRKYDIVNTDGSPNVEGRKILADVLWEENFDKVIERLEAVEAAEEKANKKK